MGISNSFDAHAFPFIWDFFYRSQSIIKFIARLTGAPCHLDYLEKSPTSIRFPYRCSFNVRIFRQKLQLS